MGKRKKYLKKFGFQKLDWKEEDFKGSIKISIMAMDRTVSNDMKDEGREWSK